MKKLKYKIEKEDITEFKDWLLLMGQSKSQLGENYVTEVLIAIEKYAEIEKKGSFITELNLKLKPHEVMAFWRLLYISGTPTTFLMDFMRFLDLYVTSNDLNRTVNSALDQYHNNIIKPVL